MTEKILYRVKSKLQVAFQPTHLEIINESDKHAGHLHAGEETHFKIDIVSEKFSGLSPVQQHRLVYDILNEEMRDGLHALSLTTKVKL